jgi:hypothetical protein
MPVPESSAQPESSLPGPSRRITSQKGRMGEAHARSHSPTWLSQSGEPETQAFLVTTATAQPGPDLHWGARGAIGQGERFGLWTCKSSVQ